MKKTLLAAASLVALSSAAFAADLPARGPAVAPAPLYAAPIFTWSGFYVGLNAGAAFRSGDRVADYAYTTTPGGVPASGADLALINADLAAVGGDNGRGTGFTGGAQAGFNLQFGALVVGLEADINALSRNSNRGGYTIVGIGGSPYDLTATGEGRGRNWFATIRPRVGYALDRTLLYVTGGLALAGNRDNAGSAVLTDPANAGAVLATWNSTGNTGRNWGWTVGAGVEHAFSDNWTAKLEYLYVNLDQGNGTTFVNTGANPYTDIVGVRSRNDDKFHVVRVGLNYKFGGTSAAAPVMARY